MSDGDTAVRVVTEPSGADVRGGARVWAAACARRDGVEQLPWQEKVAGIRARLALPGSVMFLAGRGEAVDAFAVVAEGAGGPEVFYLAVDPRAWGAGLGSTLLAAVDAWGRDNAVEQLRLWVIEDNERARAVYERAGWMATDQLQPPSDGARIERLYLRRLAARRDVSPA